MLQTFNIFVVGVVEMCGDYGNIAVVEGVDVGAGLAVVADKLAGEPPVRPADGVGAFLVAVGPESLRLTAHTHAFYLFVRQVGDVNVERSTFGQTVFQHIGHNLAHYRHACREIGVDVVVEQRETVNFKNVPTDVEELASNVVSSVKYYNLQGIPSCRPYQGMNIVVTRYANGKTRTEKKVM